MGEATHSARRTKHDAIEPRGRKRGQGSVRGTSWLYIKEGGGPAVYQELAGTGLWRVPARAVYHAGARAVFGRLRALLETKNLRLFVTK